MKHKTFYLMAGFEGALAVVAVALLALTNMAINLWGDLGRGAWLWGALAAMATYGGLWLTLKAVPRLGRQLSPHLRQMRLLFAPLPLWQLMVVAALAGVGEELLFRVFLQSWLASWAGAVAAIGIASLVFAALHWLSATYFLVTLVMGLAFGWVYHTTQSFVLVASWHGLYDLIALVVVCRHPQWLVGREDSGRTTNTPRSAQ